MTDGTKRRNIKKAAFLAAYERCGVITQACEASGVGRTSHYRWLEESEDYRKKFAESHQAAIDALETEARRRAIGGWDEPVFYNGKQVGVKRRYSDMLLAMLLNANFPQKYRSRLEHSGPSGGPIELAHNAGEQIRKALEEIQGDERFEQLSREYAVGEHARWMGFEARSHEQ